jgi:hypothetical protein
MKKKMHFSLIPLTVISFAMMVSNFILIRIDFADIFSKHPIKSFAVYLAFHLFRFAYCIFYIAILLFLFNKLLLKFHNLIISSILAFLTFFFAFAMVSDWPSRFLGTEYFLNYPILGRLFWEIQWPNGISFV